MNLDNILPYQRYFHHHGIEYSVMFDRMKHSCHQSSIVLSVEDAATESEKKEESFKSDNNAHFRSLL